MMVVAQTAISQKLTMTTIAQLAAVLQPLFTTDADRIAREADVIQRPTISKFSGSTLLKTLVFGWLANPDGSLETLSRTAAAFGVQVTPQALDQRFTARTAEFLRRMLAHAVTYSVSGSPVALPMLQRFSEVIALDSSTITLPDDLADIWPGCGGRVVQGSAAALKFGLGIDLKTGALRGPYLENARTHDGGTVIQAEPVARNGLRIADVGFFALERFAQLESDGAYWLSRIRVGTNIVDAQGRSWRLSHWLPADATRVDVPVRLGKQRQLPVRLIAVRVPAAVTEKRRRDMRREAKREGQTVSAERLALADWTIMATNAPPEMLSVDDAQVVYRARWQIELLFKLWKTHGRLTTWRTRSKLRIACEVYAKLLALFIQHWVMITGSWHNANRSLTKADRFVRTAAVTIGVLLGGGLSLSSWLKRIHASLSSGCRIDSRRKKPATYQLLQDPTLHYAATVLTIT